MNDISKIEKLIIKTRTSSFNKNNYDVTIPFARFVNSVELYTNYDKSCLVSAGKAEYSSPDEFLNRATPAFQRSNDKWTKEMQVKFIESILNGLYTTIKLFNFFPEGDAEIIDGLQRTTAICEFFKGNINPFGYSYDDLKDSLRKFNTHVKIEIYTFDSWEEIGKFYIDMNENITHSKEDITKAKEYFLREHNVVL